MVVFFPWVSIGRTDAKAETPILLAPHAKSWLIGKDPNAGTDEGQEEKGTTEDEMAGWHHWLDGHEFDYMHFNNLYVIGYTWLYACTKWIE